MICPLCGNEQPDAFSQCAKCSYIFPAHAAKIVSKPISDPMSLLSAGPKPSVLSFLGAVVGLIAIVAAFWWLLSPEGLPVPEGAYVNEQHQFALSAPADWVTLTSDNYREALQKLGDRFPKNLQASLDQHRIEVGFLKPLEAADFSPNINVVVMQGDVPELDESQMEEGSKALEAVFSRLLDAYKLEKTEMMTVDELASLHFTSRAGLKLNVAQAQAGSGETPPEGQPYASETPEQWKTFDLKMTQTLVPGKKRAYIITCTAEVSQFPQYQRIFESSIESFRVLQHPNRFGSIAMGALQGGLTAAILPLLFYIIMGIIGFVRRKS
jgi:hypothetical protein